MTDHSHHQHTPAAKPPPMAHSHARPMTAPAHTGHDHGDMVSDFRRRFWISLALTVPVLATSEMVQHLLGLQHLLAFPGDRYIEFAFASAISSPG